MSCSRDTSKCIPSSDEGDGGDGVVAQFPCNEFTLGFSDTSYVLATPVQHGTVFHEITHLIISADLGDRAPEWLDEGLAALFEQTHLVGDRYVGDPNWRGAYLKQYNKKVPSVSDLISGDW